MKNRKIYTVETYDSDRDKSWKPALEGTTKTPTLHFSLKSATEEGASCRRLDPWLKYRIVVWDLTLKGYKRGSGNRFKCCEGLPKENA